MDDLVDLYQARLNSFDNAADDVSALMASLDQLLTRVRDDDDIDDDKLRTMLGLWSAVFDSASARKSFNLAPADLQPLHWLTEDTLEDVRRRTDTIRSVLQELTEFDRARWSIDGLESALRTSLRRAEHDDGSFLDPDEQSQLTALRSSLADELDALDRRAALRADEYSAKMAAHSAREAAGQTSESVMGQYYAELGTQEAKMADAFRCWTIASFVVAGLTAAIFLLGPAVGLSTLGIEKDDYVHLIQRLVVTAGGFAVGGYLARQSHHHRSMSNWARTLGAQLKTFDAYLQPITSIEVKDQLRISFAARAFGDHPAMKGEPAVAPSAAALDTAVGWAAKLTANGK